MKRIWGSVCTATIMLAGSALFMPACNHPDASVFIEGVVYPPTPTSDGTCTFPTASATESLLSSDIVDVAVATSYQGFVLLGNQILPQADPTSDKAETSDLTITKITVHVTDSLDKTLGDYTTQVSGFIPVGAGSTAGYGQLQAELLGGPAFATLAAEARNSPRTVFSAVTSFYFTGTTLGDVTVQSDTFTFDIGVCYGCRSSFNGDFLDTTNDTCNRASTTAALISCFAGETFDYACTLCSDPICDSPGATASTVDGGP